MKPLTVKISIAMDMGYSAPILLRDAYYRTDEDHNHLDIPMNDLIDEASNRAKIILKEIQHDPIR